MRHSLLCFLLASPVVMAGECPSSFNQTVKKLHSAETIDLCQALGNKPLVVVNTASHCGYTRQFKSLEALHQRWQDKGVVVVGFPSDDFRQEAKDEAETATICYRNYGVTFTMTAPLHVKGADANMLFKSLAEQSSAPRWNFNKYVVGRDGKVVAHFDSDVEPDSVEMQQAIEKALQ